MSLRVTLCGLPLDNPVIPASPFLFRFNERMNINGADIAEAVNGLMAIPNLIALAALSPEVFRLTAASRPTDVSSRRPHLRRSVSHRSALSMSLPKSVDRRSRRWH